MATLFFSRDGRNENRAESKGFLSIEKILQFFQNHDHYYTVNPPLINPDNEPSPYSACTHVVVEIEENETNNKFTKSGFYWFPKLSPKDCGELINQPGHK